MSVLVYSVTMILTVIGAYLWDNYKKKERIQVKEKCLETVFVVLTFLPMYLVNASAYYTGGDYATYVQYFQKIRLGIDIDTDIAYYLINRFVIAIGGEFQLVYFIVCFIGYGLLLLCVKKFSDNYALTLFLYFAYAYFFRFGMNLIRQFIAVMLVFLAYEYIEKRKLILFTILIILATSFHFSAIIIWPFYFILNRKLKLSFFLMIAMVCIPFNFKFQEIMTFLFAKFKPSYLTSNYITRTFSWDIAFILCHIIALGIVFLYYDYLQTNIKNRIMINALYIGIIISTLACWLPEYKRFAYYFLFPEICLIANALQVEKRNKIKIGILIILSLILLFHLTRALPIWEVFPYKSIFQ
ncbi:EpsG family protein [Lachnoclostridium sp. An181]|uniref:EpsG family protein n=1 Tax=Lachnoclostridium sp. An181 TaxID=1965575 RepID=UPI000B37784F|nr:EpsG family protein [Lachnoclostridium sp. An181]OUP49747.1 hypothetical protein B5F18_06960 [Lachnoclostridium sp. An181]